MNVEVNGEEIDSTIPDSPTESIGFAIRGPDIYFTPMYYPERFSITTEKKLNKVPAACEGEKISIKKLKNSKIHVTGKVHTSDFSEIDKLAHTTSAVEVLTPVIQSNGMEVIVKNCERGELVGWDNFPQAQEWMFKYKMDLKSTGRDEYQSSSAVDRVQTQ